MCYRTFFAERISIYFLKHVKSYRACGVTFLAPASGSYEHQGDSAKGKADLFVKELFKCAI